MSSLHTRVPWYLRPLRPVATRFLRQTARGPLVAALPAESESAGALTRFQRWIFRLVGRLVGFFLRPSWKVAIQEWMINTFCIQVKWQPREKLQACFEEQLEWLAEHAGGAGKLGSYLEFGVYQGNSLACMYRAVKAQGADEMRLLGFDSFEGLPDSAELDKIWSPGQFRSDKSFTEYLLEKEGVDMDRVLLVKGFYDEVLTDELAQDIALETADVVMIDCDLYTSTRDALAFCGPRFGSHSVIFFDDWFSTDENHGEQKAFREFLEIHPQFEIEELDGYHEKARIFRLQRKG